MPALHGNVSHPRHHQAPLGRTSGLHCDHAQDPASAPHITTHEGAAPWAEGGNGGGSNNNEHFSDGDDADSADSPGGRHSMLRRNSSNLSTYFSPHDSVETQRQLFVDAAEMKRQLIEQMSRPQYDVRDLYHDEGWIQWIARSAYFENITLAVIMLNSLWISIDTDLNDSANISDAHWIFVVADTAFGVYFLIEVIIRFLSFKRKCTCLRDFWFVFDSLLVILTVVEGWAMPIVLQLMGGGSSTSGESSLLRMVRILRLARMMRMARLMRACPEMVMLIKGMIAAMRAVFFTLVLLIAVIYVFAVFFRRVTDKTDVGAKYFRNVPVSMNTLFLKGTLLDDMSELAVQLQDRHTWMLLPFYLFVLVSALTLMNMLIGVLCEVINAIAEVEKESIDVLNVKDSISKVLDNGGHDIDKDGQISRKQFMSLLADPMASQSFRDVDVDVIGLVDCADMIFEGDSYDDNTNSMNEKDLTFGELMGAVIGLRGSKPATVKDVVDLRKFLKKQTMIMEDRIRKQGEAMKQISRDVSIVVRDSQLQRLPSSPRFDSVSSGTAGAAEEQRRSKNRKTSRERTGYSSEPARRSSNSSEHCSESSVSQIVSLRQTSEPSFSSELSSEPRLSQIVDRQIVDTVAVSKEDATAAMQRSTPPTVYIDL